jgi:hypothetical protein
VTREFRVVQYGLGAIGRMVTRALAERPDFQLVGVIDSNPEFQGLDAGAVAEIGRPLGMTVTGDPQKVLRAGIADVVLHCTGSSLPAVYPQLELCLRAGLNVVSTCEELFYPWRRHGDLARRLAALAETHGATLLGTGVNPGFVMDVLPLLVTNVCLNVERISVTRVLDAGTRRLPFQQKVGVGLSQGEFQRRHAEVGMGHVGLTESISLLADSLGWSLDTITNDIEPVLAEQSLSTQFLDVPEGQVKGIRQIAQGLSSGSPVITMRLEMAVDTVDPRDVIEIEGTPPLRLRIDGGVPGDPATVAALLNAVPGVVAARPGLLSPRDLPLPHWRVGKLMEAGANRA